MFSDRQPLHAVEPEDNRRRADLRHLDTAAVCGRESANCHVDDPL